MNTQSPGLGTKIDIINALRGFARLHLCHTKNQQDNVSIEQGKTVSYIVDNDVIDLYAQPSKNAHYVQLFPGASVSEGASHGEPLSLLKADATSTAHRIFRGVDRNIVLLKPYAEEVIDSLLAFWRIDEKKVAYSDQWISAVAEILSSVHAIPLESRWDKFQELLDLIPVEVLYALAVDVGTPVRRINRLFEENILKAPPEEAVQRQRADPEWDDLFDELYEAKRHQISLRHKAEKLRQNVTRDVTALVQCVRLNSEEKAATRYLLLTGDSHINALIDKRYLRGVVPAHWPEFNFVRHPVSFSIFLSSPQYISENMMSAFEVLALLLTSFIKGKQEGEILFQLVHGHEKNIREEWQKRLSGKNAYSRIVENISSAIVKDINSCRRGSLMAQEEVMTRLFEELEKKGCAVPKKARHALIQLFAEGIDARNREISKAAGVLGLQLQRAPQEVATDTIVKLVLSVIQKEPSEVEERGELVGWRRLPTFLRFDGEIVTYLEAMVANRHHAQLSPFLETMTKTPACEIYLTNAFIFGLLGKWEDAERQAELGLKIRVESSDSRMAVEEFEYFWSVATRLRRDPGAIRHLEAVRIMDRMTRETKECDLRYLSEAIAQKISYQYHCYFYDGEYSNYVDEININDLEQKVQLAHERYQQESRDATDEVNLRCGTQIYGNACLLYILADGHVGGLQTRLTPRYPIDEYLKNLEVVVNRRGGVAQTSFYVDFILNATKWMREKDKTNRRAILQHMHDIFDGRRVVLPYDRKKYEDFILFVGPLVG